MKISNRYDKYFNTCLCIYEKFEGTNICKMRVIKWNN